ncbi:MAG: SCO family protein [Anaerolineae bacterium]
MPRLKYSRLVRLVAFSMALVLAGCATVESFIGGPTLTPSPPGGEVIDPPRQIPDFTLVTQDGEPFRFSDLAGKPALLYFGYTHCPDVCPLTLAEMRQAAEILGPHANDITLVFVSVDGQRDTPERLRQFLPQFGVDILGLTTTDPDELEAATKAFDVYYELEDVEDTQAGYLVAHTASTFLVDAAGQLRMIFAYRTPPSLLAEGLLAVLDETTATPEPTSQ